MASAITTHTHLKRKKKFISYRSLRYLVYENTVLSRIFIIHFSKKGQAYIISACDLFGQRAGIEPAIFIESLHHQSSVARFSLLRIPTKKIREKDDCRCTNAACSCIARALDTKDNVCKISICCSSFHGKHTQFSYSPPVDLMKLLSLRFQVLMSV